MEGYLVRNAKSLTHPHVEKHAQGGLTGAQIRQVLVVKVVFVQAKLFGCWNVARLQKTTHDKSRAANNIPSFNQCRINYVKKGQRQGR